MARITYGPLVTKIQGSIGGVTFQTNRSGAIARLRPSNPKAKTAKQSNAMSLFSQTASNWQPLTLAQKILWNDFAAANPKINTFGELKTLTGYSMFLSLNYWRIVKALPILTVPPAYVVPAPIVDYQMSLNPTQLLLDSVDGGVGANLVVITYASAPVVGVTKSTFNRMLFFVANPNIGSYPKDFTALWNSKTGLDYVSLRSTSQFNISAMFQVLDVDSGITSQGLFKTFSF